MQETIVIGHLGRDAELKESNGKKVLSFSVCHSDKYTNGQGVPVDTSVWFDCSLWEKVNVGPYLKKGTMVCVRGDVSPRAWIDEKSGELRTGLNLRVYRMELLSSGKKPEGESQAQNQQQHQSESGGGATGGGGGSSDDLPF